MTKSVLFITPKSEFCPECGAELAIRSSKHGPFLACICFPKCRYLRPLKAQNGGHVVKILEGQTCPQCESVLILRQGRFGMFISCNNYPDCGHTELIDKPDATALCCPQCRQGHLVQRRSRYGKIFYACNSYPECRFAINFTPVAGVCRICNYPLLIDKKTAYGIKRICASKQCGKLVSMENPREK